MPVYQQGDLVRFRPSVDHNSWDAVGLILEMRASGRLCGIARTLWNDMPEPRWFFISDLVHVHSGGEDGTR
jgi:hypothetical protein